MTFSLLLAFVAIIAFVVYFIFGKGQSRYYLLFVVYVLPLMNIKLIPFDYGGLTVFDIISITTLFMLPGKFFHQIKSIRFYSVPILIFMVVLILSSAASAYPSRSLFSIITVVTPFIYARFLIREILNDTHFIKELFKGLEFTCYVAMAFISIQLLVGPAHFTFHDVLNQNTVGENGFRYPGFFMDSQINGIFLAMISFIWLFNFKKFGNVSLSQLIAFSLLVAALLLTGSRSAFLGFAMGVIFLIIFIRGNLRFHLLRYVALGAVFLFFAAGTIDTFNRFKSIDNAYDFRANIWEGAIDIFEDHPILGIGMNNYKDYVMVHAQDQSILVDDNEVLYLDSPENGYLKFLVEWGVMAFIMFVLIILLPLIRMMSYYIRGHDVKMALLSAAPVIALSVSNMSVYAFADSRILILLATGLALVIVFTEYKINFNQEAHA